MIDLKGRLTALFANHCDFVELSYLGGKTWLHLCWNRNTATDRAKDFAEGRESGQWVNEKGESRDWDYVYREVVASGVTETELMESAKHYRRLIGMTMEEYLMEEVAKKKQS